MYIHVSDFMDVVRNWIFNIYNETSLNDTLQGTQ